MTFLPTSLLGDLNHERNKMKASIMNYERTGTLKSKRSVVEQGAFRELSTFNILVGVGRELYRRYCVELWISLTVLEFMYIILRQAGVI